MFSKIKDFFSGMKEIFFGIKDVFHGIKDVFHGMKDFFGGMKQVLNRAVDILYPPCCPFCDNALKEFEYSAKVCRECQKKLVYITENHCAKCGKSIHAEHVEYCQDCKRHFHYYDQARSLLSYQGKTKDALYRFKKDNRREYARFFGEEICRLLGRWIYNCKGDYLIPIPLYYKSQGSRGYNQAKLLADIIGKQIGVSVEEKLLEKVVETKQQKDLGREERGKNLERAFVVPVEARERIIGKTIILIDDIYTTGATVDAVAKVLKEAGARRVYAVTVAIGG